MPARARVVAAVAAAAFVAVPAAAVPADPTAGQRSFRAVADAYVSPAAPTQNFGRARVLRIGSPRGARSFLRFDVRGLSGPPARAMLRLFSRTGSRSGFDVATTTGRWNERRIAHRNAPRPGRRVATARRVRAGRWLSVDVTRAVLGNGRVNLVLVGRAAPVVSSREGGRAPTLIVEPEPPPQTLIAAGDIAGCTTTGDEETAALVDRLPGTVAALGDLAYETGSAADFAACYEPSWGRFKARTRPAVGNHEYETAGAAGYFAYWGAAAGTPGQGWYSYDVGAWHLVVLNSNCQFVGGCGRGSAQESWLRVDLARHKNRCTLAYWHDPMFSTGFVPASPDMAPLFRDLFAAKADLLLVGHAHNYQRWAPQRPGGVVDRAQGIREFVVGTGGRSFHRVTPAARGQEVANATTFGVLRLTLHIRSYDWKFVPVAGGTFSDSGSGFCH